MLTRLLKPIFAVIALGLMSLPVHAALIQIDIQAQNNAGNANLNLVVPVGGIIDISVLLDIDDARLPTNGFFNGATGSMAWDNGGPQQIGISNAAVISRSIANGGTVEIDFVLDSNPVFGTSAVEGIVLPVLIGENPFSSTTPLADLLLAPANTNEFVVSVGIPGGGNSVGIDVLSIEFSEGRVAIPEPSTLALFGLMVLGLAFRHQKRKR